MVSAREVLPARSISTVFSAFMSSREARTTARMSSSSGAVRSGERRKRLHARFEQRIVGSGSDPFSTALKGAVLKIMREGPDFQRPPVAEVRRSRRSCVEERWERGPCRNTQAGGARSGRARASASSIRLRGQGDGAARADRLQGPAGPVDDGHRHHPGDAPPAPPAVEARQVVRPHDPDEIGHPG